MPEETSEQLVGSLHSESAPKKDPEPIRVSVYRLKDERIGKYQPAFEKVSKREGIEITPRDMILIPESEVVGSRKKQAITAIYYAIGDLLHDELFPKVRQVVPGKTSGGTYVGVHEKCPVHVVSMNEEFVRTDKETGVKTPLSNIMLSKVGDTSDRVYEKAREMIIDHANETLQIFNTDFKIPQFPPEDKLRKI